MLYILKSRPLQQAWSGLQPGLGRLRHLPANEQGTISILSVIALLLLTMLLGMILNVGEQIDDKIKMQNGADASAYTTGAVMARSMNTIAFTNHLLSEVFALTAWFREGRERNAESLVPMILDAWQVVENQVEKSEFQLIKDIGPGIPTKILLEQDLVTAFGDMTVIKSRLLLPALEAILGSPDPVMEPLGGDGQVSGNQGGGGGDDHLIPIYQRAVVQTAPYVAIEMSRQVARQHSGSRRAAEAQHVIWTTYTLPMRRLDQANPLERWVPAIDPAERGPDRRYLEVAEALMYQSEARRRRNQLARDYLEQWIADKDYDMGPFEREGYQEGGRVYAKMSQFINLWRGFTCAKLSQLLNNEFPQSNLPHMLRKPRNPDQQSYLEREFTFDVSVYRRQRRPVMPGMYRYAIQGDAVSIARFNVFVPEAQLITSDCPRFYCPRRDWFGEITCVTPCYDNWSQEWSLFNQNWASKLIPTAPLQTANILMTDPQDDAPGAVRPNFVDLEPEDVRAVNFH